MRYLKKSNIVVLIFALTFSFIISGCYTEFSRPQAETEEDYYTIDEEEQPLEENYDEYEPYYDEEDNNEYVNYNHYDIYNYDTPHWNRYDVIYGDYYYPYDSWNYYTGYSPYSWYDPYYNWRYPSWYVGYWYSDYYWNSSRYYWDSYNYGGRSYAKTPKHKRGFTRRSTGLVDRIPRNDQNRDVAKRISRDARKVDRGKNVLDRTGVRNKRVTPDGKNRLITSKRNYLINKKKSKRILDDANPKNIRRKKMTIQRPDRKYIRSNPRAKKLVDDRVKTRTSTRKKPNSLVKPRSTKRKTTTPRIKTTRPSTGKEKTKIRPRTVTNRSSKSYRKPAARSSKSRVKPAVRRSVKPKSSSSTRKSYSPTRSSGRSSSSGYRPSGSSGSRSSSSSRGSSSRSSTRSSKSSGSKSSGSKSSGSSKKSK